jgi:hypothetical protein
VYFTAVKTAAQTIGKSEAGAGKVTIHESGMVDGTAAGATNAVIEVNTRDLVFDGGSRAFTLTVSEGGKESRTINVTLDVDTYESGAAVFKVDWDQKPAELYADLDLSAGEADLVRLGPVSGGIPGAFTGLREAIEYVDRNTEADTDYLIRVEKSEVSLPRFLITASQRENVTIRLRGTKNGPWVLQNINQNGSANVSYNSTIVNAGNAPYEDLAGSDTEGGFFAIGVGSIGKNITFILENNITVKGVGTGSPESVLYRSLFKVDLNATLVMKKGSKLTEYVSTQFDASSFSVIHVNIANTGGVPRPSGWVRIESGSITDCTFDASASSLVYFEGMATNYAKGVFYKAASTQDNPIVLTGNSNYLVCWYYPSGKNSTIYNLTVSEVIEKP